MKKVCLFLFPAVTLLSGCITDCYFPSVEDAYLRLPVPGSRNNTKGASAAEASEVVVLQEFEDLRGQGTSDSSFLVYLPLVLYASKSTERIEEDWYPRYFRYVENSVSATLTAEMELSLQRSGRFRSIVRKGQVGTVLQSVPIASDATMAAVISQVRDATLPTHTIVLSGKIRRMYVENVGYPCGLSYASVYLWMLGVPICSSYCELDIEFTARNPGGEVVWTWHPDKQECQRKRCGGLYYVSRSMQNPSKLVRNVMDCAVDNLSAAMKADPKRFGL